METDRRTALALLVATFLVYLTNFHVCSSVDNGVTRVLPFSLLREGDLDLDEFSQMRGSAGIYTVRVLAGHTLPANSIVPALLISPAYVVPNWILQRSGIEYDDVRALLLTAILERLCAAAMTAVSVALVFLTLRRRVDHRPALIGALTYALATNVWVINGQAMWTHTPVALMLAVQNFYLLHPAPRLRQLAFAGLAGAVMVGCRPQMLPFVVLAAVFLWRRRRNEVIPFAAIPLAGAIVLAIFNLRTFGTLAGHYWGFEHFSAPLLSGLAGLLGSPSRGLFVFSPVLLFSLWGFRSAWQDRRESWLRFLTIGIAIQCFVYARFDQWWGGHTYGPRYMVDILPALCLFLVPVLRGLEKAAWIRVAFGATAAIGIGVQVLGVYFDADEWNRSPVNVQDRPRRVFDWSDSQIVRAARSPWLGGELLPLLASVFRDPIPARAVRLTPEDLESKITLSGLPESVAAGSVFRFEVSVTNLAGVSWPAFSGGIVMKESVVLVAQWLRADSRQNTGGDVFRLPRNVAPGQTISWRVALRGPEANPGAHELRITVAQVIDGTTGVASKQSWVSVVQVGEER